MARSSADPTGDLGFRPVKRALVIEHDEHGPAEGAGDHLVERGYQPIFEFSVVRPPALVTLTKSEFRSASPDGLTVSTKG